MTAPQENLIYMFDIQCENDTRFYLTSSSARHCINNIDYKSCSGLNIMSAEFNESAQNQVCIKGIFEQGGVEKEHNLAGSLVKISQWDSQNLIYLISYYCTQYTSGDLEFEMICEPEVIKYNQSLLQMFSKTCRANFGDSRCKISIEQYSVRSQVIDTSGVILKCTLNGFDNGYFKNGILTVTDIKNNQFKFKILSHIENNIEIESNITFDFTKNQWVVLSPECDKSYKTCCYYFNNAVNFRGEPFIPKYNFIEN
jgi:uncharacterized phage protein (TIGR02218 family)